MTQVQLAAPALDVVIIQGHWHWPQGWTLSLATRESGATNFEREDYDGLVTGEVLSVIDATLGVYPGF